MKLTPEELREIAERAEKATPGPWHIIEDVDTQQLFGGYMAMMQLFKAPKKSEEYAEYWLNENDAAFVEQSRTDIPRLLAHIKALEEENAELAKRETLLICLEGCGVDNWEGYDDAYEMYREELKGADNQ